MTLTRDERHLIDRAVQVYVRARVLQAGTRDDSSMRAMADKAASRAFHALDDILNELEEKDDGNS